MQQLRPSSRLVRNLLRLSLLLQRVWLPVELVDRLLSLAHRRWLVCQVLQHRRQLLVVVRQQPIQLYRG